MFGDANPPHAYRRRNRAYRRPWLLAVSIIIGAAALSMVCASLYRFGLHPEWSAEEALLSLWPCCLAGLMAITLGWIFLDEEG